jgi:STE24 endopeptidase
MSRVLIFCLALMLSCVVMAADPMPAAQPAAAAPAPVTLTASATKPATLDPEAATRAYMNRLTGEKRAKSDAYFEGKYWLLAWSLLYGLAVAWLLLASRWSAKVRDAIERRVKGPNLRALGYAAFYIPATAILSLPLDIYEGYFREHQYGLSNQTFGAWFGEQMTGLGVSMVIGSLVITGLYLILRKLPRTWWGWGTLAGGAFITLMIMVAPVFIAPLFNTYQPLPDGPLRDDILAMARANNIPADNVYWFDASKQTKRISANVSGLFGTTRISLNDNLLNRTSPAEIRAVMGREMGHYVLNHVHKAVIFFTLVLLGGMLFLRFGWAWAHARFGERFGIRDMADPAGLPLLVALFSVYMFFATPVTNTITRVHEIEADYFGLNASREPDGFAEAIFKLSEYRKLEPAPLEEAIFFTHPSGYNRILASMRWKAAMTK